MKIISYTLLAIFFMFNIYNHSQKLNAQPLSLYLEWLYLQSSIDDPYFAVETNSSATGTPPGNPYGTRFANEQQWHSAYRLGMNYCVCDQWAAELRWTHFPHGKNQKTATRAIPTLATNQSQFLINGLPDVSFADETSFYELDLVGNLNVWRCRDWHLHLRGGARYGRISHKEHVVNFEGGTLGSRDFIEFSSKVFGFGPTIGCIFSAPLWRCLSVIGNFNTSLLVSRIHARESFLEILPNLVTLNNVIYNNEPYWIAVPTFEAEVGLDFSRFLSFTSNCCYQMNIQAGYAFISYFRSIDRIRTINSTSNRGPTFDQYMTFLLHGPYVRLGICF